MLEQDEMEEESALKRIFSNAIPTLEEKVKILQGATSNNSDNHSAYIIQILKVESKNVDSSSSSTVAKNSKSSFLNKIQTYIKNTFK